jgi:hypothetical protein
MYDLVLGVSFNNIPLNTGKVHTKTLQVPAWPGKECRRDISPTAPGGKVLE